MAIEQTAGWQAGELPEALRELGADRIVGLDVRPDLRSGQEPFGKIMAAVDSLGEGQVLQLEATFDPIPLYAVLGRRGFAHWTEKLAEDHWRVSFYREATTAPTIRGELDVRVIPPREKHPTIFATYEALGPGEAFVLVNDHDPRPLRFQFEAQHAGRFGWEYLEQGPTLWRVAISKPAHVM